MKYLSLAAIVAALATSVSAHYRFISLTVGSTVTGQYQYVRQNTNYNSPVTDVTSDDLSCNVGGETSGTNTSTYTVAAGSLVGFQMDQAVYHPGPLSIWLGKAPSTLTTWTGSGDYWTKIYELGPTFSPGAINWPATNVAAFNTTIPSDLAPGAYLLRIEHIGLHVVGAPQFYISCAQLQITGSGSKVPPTVALPGAYALTDPGLAVDIYYPIPTNYTPPGPVPWTG